MGLLATMLTDGGPGLPRPIRYVVNVVTHPIRWLKSMSLRRWAERSVILLVMQSYDNSLRLILKRGIFGTRVVSRQGHGVPNPTYIPIANEAARIAAEAMNGDAMSSINEVLLNRPTTAHILGGAAIGADASTGVIDAYHRVFGHPDLHVVDGAAVGANLGVNPSLSITAMAERAIAMWPNNGDEDPRPPIATPYREVEHVRPDSPTVDAATLGVDVWE